MYVFDANNEACHPFPATTHPHWFGARREEQAREALECLGVAQHFEVSE